MRIFKCDICGIRVGYGEDLIDHDYRNTTVDLCADCDKGYNINRKKLTVEYAGKIDDYVDAMRKHYKNFGQIE